MTDPSELLADVPRGVTSRFLREQKVPMAFFQAPETIAAHPALQYDPANPGGKILLGAVGDRLIGVADDRHILTVAGSRAGKSVTLINNLHFYRGSVLCTDPKAELASKTATIRAALGQRVVALDPFGMVTGDASQFRGRYNPLVPLTDPENQTIVEDAAQIVDALVIRSGEEKDPHWNESAAQFLVGLVLYTAIAPNIADEERTLPTVRRFVTEALKPADDGENFALPITIFRCLRHLRDSNRDYVADAIEASITGFYQKSDTERAGVLSTAHRHTQFLDYAAMRDVLSGHDFDLRDLKRFKDGMSIYLCLPATRMGMCRRWLRLFVNQLLQAMEQEKSLPRNPVLLCLDEFPVLGFMSQLQDAAGQVAALGVKLWIILQDWGQGEALYGKRFESFAANSGVLQAFGAVDLATTEYLSRRLDKTVVETVKTGETADDQRRKGLSGENQARELHDLMRPDEITRFFSRDDPLKRQLILIAGKAPIILQRVDYYEKDSPFSSLFPATP